jgi:hypothetical protein
VAESSGAPAAAGVSGAVGYSIVLPPQWHEIPLRSGTVEAIRSILNNAITRLRRDLPRDKVAPYRTEIERRLTLLSNQARRNGGLCLYLPVEPMHGIPVAASFVISEGSVGSGGTDPSLVTSELAAAQEGATPCAVGGSKAVRIERIAGPDLRNDVEFGSRRIDYVIPVPGQEDHWLIAAFSTVGTGDPEGEHADLLAQLFDAIMSTFRWTEP